MPKQIQEMAVLIEFIAGSMLAVFFHSVLQHEEAAFIIFGIGILLSLATYLLRENIEQTREILIEQYAQAHEIPFAIAKMTDPECRNKAHEIMAATQRTVALLTQGYLPLEETEFYMRGTKYFDQSCHYVKAVDPVTAGWDTRGALLNYYQANLRALERGVRITRIFMMSRQEMTDLEVQKVLLAQVRDGIEVRIAIREELPLLSDISSGDTASSFDFAVYDGKVATEVFSAPGKYFGRKTRDPVLVGNYQRLFELVEHSSHIIAVEENQVTIAAESLKKEGQIEGTLSCEAAQEVPG